MKFILIFFISIYSLTYSFTVHDPINYAVNLENKLNTLEQIDNQIRGLENQAKSLVNQAKQLQKFDLSLSMGSIQNLRNNLQKIIALQNNTQSTINYYTDLQTKFVELYPDYTDDSFLTASDYSRKAKELSKEINNVTYDAMKSLEIISPEKYNNDTERIDAIMDTAKDAEGQLQAIQAVVQLSAGTAQQLMELKYLTGQSLKLQSTYIVNRNQEEIRNLQNEKSNLRHDMDTNNESSGIIDNDGNLLGEFF